MLEAIAKIEEENVGSIFDEGTALPVFTFENGYALFGKDLGDGGAKIELCSGDEDGMAIILPPIKAKELGKWLLNTLGEEKLKLPKDLLDILERLVEQKGNEQRLKRGDKTKLKKAIQVLKPVHSKN